MITPEHQCIAENIDNVLNDISATSLLGILEADRKKFDYGCIIQRDFSRPLVSQVLWKNHDGIEKDLRSLIFESTAKLKLYIFKDSVRARNKINEITQSYKNQPHLAKQLSGLRFFPIPPDFDADKEENQAWIYTHLQSAFVQDILIQIIFGHFRPQDFQLFIQSTGTYGLKHAILHEITMNGMYHTPTFKKRLGRCSDGPIREAILVLKGAGFIRSVQGITNATIKGRLFLDLTRKILFEHQKNSSCSSPLQLITDSLGISLPELKSVDLDKKVHRQSDIEQLIRQANYCRSIFGRDLLHDVDEKNPRFFKNNFIDHVRTDLRVQMPDEMGFESFTDESSLLYLDDFESKIDWDNIILGPPPRDA